MCKRYSPRRGAEILLQSDFIIAHTNLNAGLVEVKIGLAPGFGGIKEAFARASGNKKLLTLNIKNILTYNKSSSAEYFIKDYSIKNSKIVMNKNSLIHEALKLPKKRYS